MRLALCALLVTGCTTVPPLSEAPGAKRLPTTDTGTSAPVVAPAKHRPRHRLPTLAVSRSLRRSVVGSRWYLVARCESGGNPRANTGNGYYGLYQFDVQTWRSVGGRGLPSDASPAEQTHRAELLYADRGAAPWPICGRYL